MNSIVVFPSHQQPFLESRLARSGGEKSFNFGGGYWDYLAEDNLHFLCLTWYCECSH